MRFMPLAMLAVFVAAPATSDEVKVKVNRIEMSSAALADTDGDPSNESGDRAVDAQDYNSSRSNNINAAEPGEPGDGAARSRVAQAVASGSSDNGGTRSVSAQDYNSSRSNNFSVADPGGPSGDGTLSRVAEAAAADGADYNSSRSNKTHAPERRAPGNDDCGDDADDNCSERAAPPANHNTTRSNRTSE